MAVQHPIAGIVGDKLDGARLGDADKHGITGPPTRFRNSPTLRSCHVEGVTVHVHRVMVHAQIHEANPHAVAQLHD
jgi:hypothetical protein